MGDPAKARHDWYQTGADVVITILLKNTQPANVEVNFAERNLSVTVRRESPLPDYSLELDLAHAIQPDKSTWRCFPSKIEVKARKAEQVHWSCLEGEDPVLPPPSASISTTEQPAGAHGDASTGGRPAYPTSNPRGPKNWDAIEKEVMKEEENEKLDGDAAVNKVFQQIYGSSDEKTKRAMMKSFLESNGTVLSTNWDEVGAKHVDCHPPDGMEWKNYD